MSDADNDIVIRNAHTGVIIRVNRYCFLSLDELKAFCSTQLNVPKNHLFLLTSFGHRLKSSSLDHVKDIYVFDKNLFVTDTNAVNSNRAYTSTKYSDELTSLIHPINSPLLDVDLDKLAKSKESRQLIGLLTTNLGWIAAIESDSTLYLKKSAELRSRVESLFSSMRVAYLYIKNYSGDVKNTFDSTIDFLNHLQKQSLNATWETHYNLLRDIHTVEGSPLSSLLNRVDLAHNARESFAINKDLTSALLSQRDRLSKSLKLQTEVEYGVSSLENDTTTIFNMSDPDQWLTELKQMCDKTQGDTKKMLQQTKTSMDALSIDLILEMLQAHKSDYVTKIYDLALSLYRVFTSYKDLLAKIQLSLSSLLHKLSLSQAEAVTLKESLRSLSPQVEKVQILESSLAHTVDLPLLYGFYVVEGVRRSAWLKAVKEEISQTNEEFAIFRDKEIKIRSNWVKNYGDILKLLKKDISLFSNNGLTNFEVVANTDKTVESFEEFTFNDAQIYIEELRRVNVSAEVVKVLFKALDDISSSVIKKPVASKTEPKDATIQGYKYQIKKLESLLHQEQFKNFQQWPSSERLSIISKHSMDEKLASSLLNEATMKTSSTTLANAEELKRLNDENRNLKSNLKRHKETVEMLNDELKRYKHELSTREFENNALSKDIEHLRDEHSSQISHFQFKLSEQEVKASNLSCELEKVSKCLQEATESHQKDSNIIDQLKNQHKVDLKELQEQIENKNTELDSIKKKSMEPQQEIERLNSELVELKAQLVEKESHINATNKTIYDLKTSLDEKSELLKEKDSIIKNIEESSNNELNVLKMKVTELDKVNDELSTQLGVTKDEYDRLKSMKNDLLENMANRENEFASEKGVHQREIEELTDRLKQLESAKSQKDEEIDKVSKIEEKHIQMIFQLLVIINSLVIKSRDLSDIMVTFYDLFCESLKCMGLLAVKSEKTNKIDIIRVKGLKKANGGDLSATVEIAQGLKTDLPAEVHQCSIWSDLPDKQLLKLDSIENDLGPEKICSIVDSVIETYNLTTFEEKYLKFVDLVTNLNELYLGSVSKRFKEVEHLAKKELKDNRKLRQIDSKKITIRDFNKGDLVLFLPTRSRDGTGPQWAVFNEMGGDFKYMMKNTITLSTQKQWFIGRILDIEEVNRKEYLITAEEISV